MAQIILDSSALYALLDRREEHHPWAIERLADKRGTLLTCDAVLTETYFLLNFDARGSQQLASYLRAGYIRSRFDSPASLTRLLDLMEAYQDVPMSFADACLVCLVEDNPGSCVFTLDSDFKIYRQHRRRLIPLIAPF